MGCGSTNLTLLTMLNYLEDKIHCSKEGFVQNNGLQNTLWQKTGGEKRWRRTWVFVMSDFLHNCWSLLHFVCSLSHIPSFRNIFFNTPARFGVCICKFPKMSPSFNLSFFLALRGSFLTVRTIFRCFQENLSIAYNSKNNRSHIKNIFSIHEPLQWIACCRPRESQRR